MSIEALNWVMNDAPHANHSEFAVLIGLANHAHADGKNSFPAVSKIAQYASISERTVQRVLRELEDRGLIRRGNQEIVNALIANPRYRPTCYDLDMTLSRKSRGDTVSPLTDLGVTSGQLRGDKQVASGVTQCHPNQELKPQPKTSSSVCQLSDQRLTDRKLSDTTEEEDGPSPATPTSHEAIRVLDELGKFWNFGKRGKTHLTRPVSEALRAGHSASSLLSVLLVNPGAVRRPVAVLAARLEDLPEPGPKTLPPPPKCDACGPTRWIEHPTTGRDLHPCPTCHPTTQKQNHLRSVA